MILSASGVVTEFSNLHLGNLNDGKCSNFPYLKMYSFKRGFNYAALLKTLLLHVSLSVCIDMGMFGLKHHVRSLIKQHVSLLLFVYL